MSSRIIQVVDDCSYYQPENAHPEVVAANQIDDAVAHITADPSTLVRWPYPSLDALTGPMGGGEVWFTAAFSGGGKTTFVVSTIEAWRLAGKRVYVMPLELTPNRFRTYLACMETGINPGDALSRQLRSDPSRAGDLERLTRAVRAQNRAEYAKLIRISAQRSIDVAGLETAMLEAADFGADVVIVDHIDHIAGGNGSNLPAESSAVNTAALRLAQDHGLLLWFTSQLNMEIGKGRDHLAKFGPPMQHHLMYPTAKIKNATGIIGLFRPVRKMLEHETPKEYAQMLTDARAGTIDAPLALQHGVMGVNIIKLRNNGQNEGKKIALGFERGRVVPLLERDRYTTPAGYPRRVI